ncbi:MAG: hypothetical protein DMF85_10510 [Acidobacteria bacterium]|nr:MAG: hypothetical protein DMF85_10510 [Acidobacteriota bacterium]
MVITVFLLTIAWAGAGAAEPQTPKLPAPIAAAKDAAQVGRKRSSRALSRRRSRRPRRPPARRLPADSRRPRPRQAGIRTIRAGVAIHS